MTVKTKVAPRAVAAPRQPLARPSQPAPLTEQDRLNQIAALGQRITGYVEFMNGVNNLRGVSAETKERAITAFHERLVVLEKLLSRIQEDVQLG